MTTSTRKQLLDEIYKAFLNEIQSHIVDLEKIQSAGIANDWYTTLLYMNQITVDNAELIISMYNLQSEVIPGHYNEALGVVKNFITRIKSL